MGQPFDEPPYPPLTARDFGPGKAYRVEYQNAGQTIAIGEPSDHAFQTAHRHLQPAAGIIDVVLHGLPGRFIESLAGTRQIAPAVIAELLNAAGIAKGTPLRLVTCHAAEAPRHGQPVALQLAHEWGGLVMGASGQLVLTKAGPRIDLVEWEPDPAGGMRPDPVGVNQGAWVWHRP